MNDEERKVLEKSIARLENALQAIHANHNLPLGPLRQVIDREYHQIFPSSQESVNSGKYSVEVAHTYHAPTEDQIRRMKEM